MLGVYICVELFNRIFPIKTITFATDIVITVSTFAFLFKVHKDRYAYTEEYNRKPPGSRRRAAQETLRRGREGDRRDNRPRQRAS